MTCRYVGGPACARCASTRRSSRRELIPSLVNTLPRCHSTVRALRNSWAPISVLVWPSRASRADYETLTYRVSFGEADSDGRQALRLHALTGDDAREDSAAGDLVLEGRTGETASGSGTRLWAGRIADRVRRAAIISGIPPYLLKTGETPQGVPQEVFDQIAGALTADRFAYFTEWNKNFFNTDHTLGTRISAEVVQDAWNSAVSASPAGTVACVATWHTDFRDDLPKIDIPVLVMHGTADRILPIEACGPRTHELIKGSDFVAVDGAGHGLCWTHAEEVNAHLVPFLS